MTDKRNRGKPKKNIKMLFRRKLGTLIIVIRILIIPYAYYTLFKY